MTAPAVQNAGPGPDLGVRLGPLRLEYPVINASGTMELFDMADALGPELLREPPVAAYVAKTITFEPRAGNRPPRIMETPAGLINAIGLEGEGAAAFFETRLPRLLGLPCPVIVSIGGFSLQEYVLLASGLRMRLEEGSAGDATDAWMERVGLELNISCPNVHSGCASIGAEPSETERVVAAVREVWPGLLMPKLTPNVTDIAAVARAAVRGGADAVAAVNTFKGLVIDRRTLRPYLGNTVGGLSGPAIKPLALRCLYELAEAVDVPLVGMGGVADAEDVMEFLACGATVVAVGASLFRDPWVCAELASDLRRLLQARGMTLSDVIGVAHKA